MLRSQTAIMCATGALIAATFSFGLAVQDPDPQMVALQEKMTALEDKVERYDEFMEAQAAAGEALIDALARSEAEGFTAGINPRSREILLAGLRKQAEAMKSAAAEEEEAAPRRQDVRGRRRGQ